MQLTEQYGYHCWTRASGRDAGLLRLIRDYGYDVQGNVILSGRRYFGRCRSIFDAAERLCPIIRDTEYTDRLSKLTAPCG